MNPRTIPFFDLKRQYQTIKKEVETASQTVFESGDFLKGAFTKQLIDEFSEILQVKHMIPVANGSDGLFIGLSSLGIKENDEVITTSHSWIATFESILRTGAQPVFVDTDPYHLLDTSKIEAKITNRTKAILPVHLYGQSCKMEEIKAIGLKYGLPILEDCAQSFGASRNNILTGTTGEIGVFSFYPTKNLGAYGDAGCIVTNDAQLADRCRTMANNGIDSEGKLRMMGLNSRMDEIQAAILRVKLNYVQEWNTRRAEIAGQYTSLLSGVKQVTLPEIQQGNRHIFHQYVIQCDGPAELMKYLKHHGIETKVHYPEFFPSHSLFKKNTQPKKDLQSSFKAHKRILSLPIFPELEQEEIHYISQHLKNFYNE